MFNGLKKMKINQKLLAPNLIYLVLLGIVVFFFFNSGKLMTDLSRDQNENNGLLASVRNTLLHTKDYLSKTTGYDEIKKQYELVEKQLREGGLKASFKKAGENLKKIDALRTANKKIEDRILQLTEVSMAQSNGFIKQMVLSLADEEKRKDVSTLERMVILGASVNTNSNYEIRILFSKLAASLDAKEAFFKFVETLVKNTKKDTESLKGTPFQGMAEAAQKANLEIKALANDFVKNTEEIHLLQTGVYKSLEKATKDIDTLMDKQANEFFSKMKGYFSNILILLLIAIVTGIGLSVLISRSISRNLKRTIAGLSEASEQISSASGQVAGASQQLAEGSSEQAASIQETSASLEEISSMTKQNADNANQADDLMKDANQIVGEANSAMVKLTDAMSDISNASEETGKIIKTIDEIAFQTNLLALNAAVEAARAGEAGAGFAVVADEVRNLAMRAADAAKNTSELIEGTVAKVRGGSELVEQSNNAFSKVTESSSKVAVLVGEISAASHKQAEGVEQVNRAVTEMDKVVQQNAANAEESASASEEMNAQAEEMKAMVLELVELVGKVNSGTGYASNNRKYHTRRNAQAKREQKRLPETSASYHAHK